MPIPSPDEIVRSYKAGELPAKLACYHEGANEEPDPFIEQCVALHNSGDIDLVSIPSQPGFAAITGHSFFVAQQFYCEAIPKLHTKVSALMECCRILIEQAGADLAATWPNGAFRTWCQNNPDEGAVAIRAARAGDNLAKRFVTFALQAAGDAESACDFVRSYADDRRISGMAALAGMTFVDAAAAQKASAVLEPFVADTYDDHIRSNALVAAFDLLKKHNDAETARRLIDAAATQPGPATLHGLAQIVSLHHAFLNDEVLRTALLALELVNPERLGTVRVLDMGLRHLLGTKGEAPALHLLMVMLRNGKLTLENFQTTVHELTHGHRQRLYELIVRWLLSGSMALCSNVSELIGIKDRAFDTTVQSLGLTALQQIFLCRKAIGFLFLKPVALCSIIVSVIRAGDRDVEGPVTELLFDPILLNYGGDAKDYLKRIPADDLAYQPIQNVLARDTDFHAGLNATGMIKELHPSDYQRDVIRQRTHDQMRTIHKMAESKSVFLNLVHRSTVLYGKQSLIYVTGPDGSQRSIAMDFKSLETSFELPRLEILDPVGLDYMLRIFRAEKLK